MECEMNSSNYSEFTEFGKKLLNCVELEEGLILISDYSARMIGAERCSVFIHDKDAKELWTIISDKSDRIIIDSDKGIAGRALKTRFTVIENQVANNQFFLNQIDKENTFKTKNIIAAPILDSHRNAIGVLQLLNKDGDFDGKDRSVITFFATFISSFIELAFVKYAPLTSRS